MPTLHWLNKDKTIKEAKKVPYRILKENKDLSYGNDINTENMIIKGDNLEVLKSLLPYYTGKVKCIYIDPPYNTGNIFEHYNDNLEHSIWLNMMYPRLELMKQLLAEDGVIFVQINDDEYAYLKVIMDEIFGRDNFETVFNIKVRHENRILREDIRYQLVIEYLLCYKKTNKFIVPRRDKIKNSNDDYIYNIEILENTNNIAQIGSYNVEIYKKNQYKIHKVKDGQFKQYQIRGSLITQQGSASEYYEKYLRERRHCDGLGTLYKVLNMGVRGDGLGYRYIIQPDKENSKNGFYFQGKPIVSTENKGLPYPNFYDFVDTFNNVGYEGNIDFKNGKKPEEYIKFFLNTFTKPNDLILDCFLGSGTTAAVAHKMNRKYIGVELGDHAITHVVPRLKKVIDGSDQGGISKSVDWKGGGGYKFYELGETIFDEKGKIRLNIDFNTLANHIWFSETSTSSNNNNFVNNIGIDGKTALLGIYKNTAYILLYNGILRDKRPIEGNVLTNRVLRYLKELLNGSSYTNMIIYGDACKVRREVLEENKILFKQIPYDVKGKN